MTKNRSDRNTANPEKSCFLRTVYERSLEVDDDNVSLAAELVEQHNSGAIDLASEFLALENNPATGIDFFLTQHVFERALPQINSPVLRVMQCVWHLYREAGRNGAAGHIIDAFRSFCENKPDRISEALSIIRDDTGFSNLLSIVLIAGLNTDTQHYVEIALRYTASDDPDIARSAVVALGRTQWAMHPQLLEAAYVGLENIVKRKTNGDLLAEVMTTAFSFLKADLSQEDRVNKLTVRTLKKGGNQVTRATSWLLAFDTSKVPNKLLDILISHVAQADPLDAVMINNLDRCLAKMLASGTQDRAVAVAEGLLLSGPQRMDMKSLDSFARAVRKEPALMNRLATKWLLRGERSLCEAVVWIAGAGQGANLKLEADVDELRKADTVRTVFLARKTISYLFFNPISAASLIISLMRRAPDDDALTQLGNLLFDPLLLNWTGKAHEYVQQCVETESGKTKQALERILGLVNEYLEGLRAVGELPELHPSIVQQETYHRKFSREMAEAFEKAEGQSPMLSIFPKRVLLYGRKSIDYVYGPDGQSQRTEFPLGSHTVKMEVPRLQQIDPFGLDYTLRVFMSECLRS